MKKTAIATITLIAIFLLFWVATTRSSHLKNSNFKRLEQAIMDAQPNEDILRYEIIPQLNKAIEAHPDDLRLIRHRLAILIRLSLLENAQRDATKLIDLTNDDSVRFIACMLAESIGDTMKETSLECYRNVYKRYSSKVTIIDSFHISTALMGEMPEAEKILTDYLKNEPNEELRRWYAELFIPFNREDWLYTNHGGAKNH